MKQLYVNLLMLAILFVSSSRADAQAPSWLWAKSAGGTASNDNGYAVTADAGGNIYVVGQYWSASVVFGSTTLTNAGGPGDVFLAKYDPAGNVLWATSAGGLGYDYGYAVATDAASNVYITGGFVGLNIAFGSTSLTNASTGSGDFYLAKYTSAGSFVWARGVGGGRNDYGQGVSTDLSGNVYVAGYFQSTSVVFGSTTLTNTDNTATYDDFFVAKYTSAGNVLWAKTTGNSANHDIGWSASADLNGDVFVCGWYASPAMVFGSTTLTNSGSGNYDMFIAKYSSTGNVLWAKGPTGAGFADEYANSVYADPSGNAYVAGSFRSSTMNFGSQTLTNAAAGFNDVFLAKYDGNGNFAWALRAGGASGDAANGVTTDAGGSVFLTGPFSSASIVFGTTTVSGTGGDVFVAKFDGTGNAIWAKGAGGTASETPNGICTDAAGDAYVTGIFQSTNASFDSNVITNANTNSTNDIFVAKIAGALATGLIDFNGSWNGNATRLQWSTASETNNDFFSVERSTDGKIFEPVGKVKGAGNTTALHNYSFTDPSPLSNWKGAEREVYYRLSQADYDGKISSSNTISILMHPGTQASIGIYPNPAGNVLNFEIYSENTEPANITVLDVLGNVIMREQQKISRGSNAVKLGMDKFIPGIYFLEIETPHTQQRARFVKN